MCSLSHYLSFDVSRNSFFLQLLYEKTACGEKAETVLCFESCKVGGIQHELVSVGAEIVCVVSHQRRLSVLLLLV